MNLIALPGPVGVYSAGGLQPEGRMGARSDKRGKIGSHTGDNDRLWLHGMLLFSFCSRTFVSSKGWYGSVMIVRWLAVRCGDLAAG